MAAFSGSALRRLIIQSQSSLAAVLNSSGTWTTTGAKLVPYENFDLKPRSQTVKAKYKFGTSAQQAGLRGRVNGFGSKVAVPFMPSGTAGTVPQADALIKACFGAAATIVSTTSATYSHVDGVGIPVIVANFNETGSGNTSQFGFGGIPTAFRVNLGGDGYAVLDMDIDFFNVLESDFFSTEESGGKGGLTTFPAEPGSLTHTGGAVDAFATATCTFGGTAVAEFVSAQIAVTTGRSIRADGGRWPTGVVQGDRTVMLSSLKFADSDGAGLAAIKVAKDSKATMDVVISQGATAGYIMTHTLKGVQFDGCSYSVNGNQIDVDFGDAQASPSGVLLTNEYSLALT